MAKGKIWSKGLPIDQRIERFTIGKDREFDLELAEFDVLGSLAHVTMLSEQGLIDAGQIGDVKRALRAIYKKIQQGEFQIEEGIEDVHSQVELLLGKEGGRIHTGRSRNDQVLVDLKLFYRQKLDVLIRKAGQLSLSFLQSAEEHKDVLMPGYTHTQIAMTSSFGMWFAAFAEGLKEDVEYFIYILTLLNKNPLGSAAGYGSSFPISRQRTTELLGFDGLHVNPINAQYNRGKSEMIFAQGLASLAFTINKFANDMILYSNENYRFLKLPAELTTGSSIMPHKKNPDVFELIRAHTNIILNLPGHISNVISNLTTGYHRDFQLLKESLFPAIAKMEELLDILAYTLPRIEVSTGIVDQEKYKYLTSVDAVNELVKKGVPFREAYLRVGQEIESGQFNRPDQLEHTHEGSLGNLNIERIRSEVQELLKTNPYQKIEDILSRLLKD